MPRSLSLGADELRDLFPSHLGFDASLTLVQVGSTWDRILPEVHAGARLLDHFEIVRPAVAPDFALLKDFSGRAFVLRAKALGLSLRGQLRHTSGAEARLLFLGFPWITDPEDLTRFGLSARDFPAHEPISDYLLLIQSQRLALRDAGALSIDLQRREGTLRAVLDNAAEGIITIDTGGRIQSFNAAAARIFGYDPAEVIGRDVSMLMPSPHREAHAGYVAAYLRTGEARIIGHGREVEGLHKDGTRVPVELSVSEVVFGNDRLFTGIVRDLSERRRSAAQLRASELRLAQLMAAMKAGTWEWDFAAGRGYWSDQNYRQMGLEPGSIDPSPEALFTRIHPDDLADSRAAIQRALEGEGPLEYEHRIVLPDGTLRWLRDIGAITRDEQGVPIRMSGITLDTTAWHDAEAVAREARERAERRSAAQRALVELLSRASTIDEALVGVLRVKGELLEWDAGFIWLVDPNTETLRCRASWYGPRFDSTTFADASSTFHFSPGRGIPGQVWAYAVPAWVPDTAAVPSRIVLGTVESRVDEEQEHDLFPRRRALLAAGLRTLFAAPVFRGGEAIGVIEFASRTLQEPDRETQNMFGSLGTEIGEFITRIEALEALRTSEQHLREVIDTSLDAVISIDLAGRIVDWNPQAETIFGWTPDEVAGVRIDEVIIPEDFRAAHRRGMAHYRATGEGAARAPS